MTAEHDVLPADMPPVQILAMRELRPGDVVILRTERRLSIESHSQLRAAMETVLPEGVKAAVICENMQIEILRTTTAPEH